VIVRAAEVIRRVALSGVVLALAGCAANPALSAAPSAAPTATPTASAAPTPSPTEASASPTAAPPRPDGQLAFVKEDYDESGDTYETDIYLVNTDSPELARVTNDARQEHGLVWAPDGRRLYYESVRQVACGMTYCFPNRLFSIRPDGSDRRDLGRIGSRATAHEAGGAISPNNLFVAYPGDGDPGGIPVVILDLQQGIVRPLSQVSTVVRWSPDSSRLLLLHIGKGIEVIDRTGKTVLRLDDSGVESIVGWTPDGRSILFRSCEAGLPKDQVLACLEDPPWGVSVEDPGSARTRYEGPIPPTYAAWSPDGQWVANVEPDGLYVGASIDERVLVFPAHVNADYAEYPAWSPGADWIAFRGPETIVVVPRTGGDALPQAPGYFAAWRPPVID
jgi:Tol biopolymer transport system component